ncbi:unnamed protein product [Penicillium olsonii]|uniref:Prolyl 4-hydroxylase alpha subunit Fe(2+) 2OG dioxygenase domain-containing protein n=1 Tax=Penicillium olsonii TaxID=99116 RepID=A0A9W4MUW0_PENOL|nr:unnamed protein product [Penicillium olsonii]CAG8157068.1 unnamed protein product [Penicillium olsonii]
MFQTAFCLRVASRRLPLSTSLRYSSFSKVNRAPATATASAATGQVDEAPFPRWNAVGNEAVTADSITALLTNDLSNLGVKNFLSSEERARMVDIIRTHTIDSYGANVQPPIGKVGVTQFDNQNDKKAYFESVPSARALQDRFIKEANIDIVGRVASYLHTVTTLPVRLAREGNQEYFAGLLRLINSSALIHADYGAYDAPGWEIGRISAQLSWNVLLREVQGGECVIYRRFWEGKSDDETFRQPSPGYGYRKDAVEGCDVQVVQPEVGEFTLFNSRNFHSVNAVRQSEIFPRYTVSSFIGLLPTAAGGFEIILWS